TITRGGLVPQRISGFGIEFSEVNQIALLWILAWMILYFCLTFGTYAYSEITELRLLRLRSGVEAVRENNEKIVLQKGAVSYLDKADQYKLIAKAESHLAWYARWCTWPLVIRGIVEFGVPYLVAIAAYVSIYNMHDKIIAEAKERPEQRQN